MRARSVFIGLAILFQIAVVATMAISREWILANGTPLTFQTAPIDPRDIFRGDYVRLDYLFSNVPAAQLDRQVIERGLRKGQKVYLAVSPGESGVAQGERLYLSPPEGMPYLLGRVRYEWPYRGYLDRPENARPKMTLSPVSVKYGIEQYYVEQGSGRLMEERRGGRNDFQLPMLIHTKVSTGGEAVIAGYDWADIAVKTEVERSPERDAPDELASAVIRLTLKNSSDRAMTLPLAPGNCSFTLIAAQRAPQDATRFAGERSECVDAPVSAVTLAPGETHAVSFDLNRPIWYVRQEDKLTPPGRLSWNYRYRIAYRGETIPGVRGAILSRAFNARGNVD